MAKISLDLDDELLEDLKKQANKNKVNCNDLIEKYVQKGLINKEGKNMKSVIVPDDIMEKINSRSRELNCNPEKLIHSVLFDYLRKVESIPSTIDCERIMAMLEQDNPEGDDILDNLIRLGKKGWD